MLRLNRLSKNRFDIEHSRGVEIGTKLPLACLRFVNWMIDIKTTEATLICVAGVDGCPAGWIVAHVPIENDTERRLVLCKNFDEVLCFRPRPKVIAIDGPIGLLDEQNAVHVNVTAKLEAF